MFPEAAENSLGPLVPLTLSSLGSKMMISWPPWKSWKQPSGPRASLWRWFLKGRSWTTPTTKNASSTCITTAPTWPSSASIWDTAACGKPCCTCSTRWDPQTRLSHGCTCLAHLAWPTQLSGGAITPLNLTPGFSCRIILGRVKSRWQILGISLLVQWLGLYTFTAEDSGSIPGQGTRILRVVWHDQKKKQTHKWQILSTQIMFWWACKSFNLDLRLPFSLAMTNFIPSPRTYSRTK